MSGEIEGLAYSFASRAAARIEAKWQEDWEALSPVEQELVKASAYDLSKLMFMAVGHSVEGLNLDFEVKFARSTLDDWAFVSSSRMKVHLLEAIKELVIEAVLAVAGLVV